MLIQFIFLFSFSGFNITEPPQLDRFDVARCELHPIEGEFEAFVERIIDSTFTEDKLEISIGVIANCGIDHFLGDIEINNDTLILKYGISPPGKAVPGYFCDCIFKITYEINHLPPKAYLIKISDQYYSGSEQKFIQKHPEKYISKIYSPGLTNQEYEELFLQKFELQETLIREVYEIAKSIRKGLEQKIMSSEKLNQLTETFIEKAKIHLSSHDSLTDFYIRLKLGEENVNEKEKQLDKSIKEFGPKINAEMKAIKELGIDLNERLKEKP